MQQINGAIETISNAMVGWPLILYVIGAGIICTIALRFIQIRYFAAAWKFTLTPTQGGKGDMTPLQAFIGTLNSNLGNGSIAGTATAIAAGGPGAAFWIVAAGLILMAVRFAEVYLGIYFGALVTRTSGLGGPMLYLRQIPGGALFTMIYSVACLLFCLNGGNVIQANSIAVGVQAAWGIPPLVTAAVLLAFTCYVVYGGAARIVKAAEAIIPVKVGLFFVSSTIVIIYHYQSLFKALSLIVESAFTTEAMVGGAVGFTIQQAMRYGMMRSIMATESGVGTASIFFGSTGSKDPLKDSVMSMLSTFISSIVCFLVGLCIVISGVWNSGLNSTALTIAAFQTVFGATLGGWIVNLLAISFGLGVLVVFAYLARESWFAVTGGRWGNIFNLVYCALVCFGPFAYVNMLWNAADIVMTIMLLINLFGVVYLLPTIRKGIAEAEK